MLNDTEETFRSLFNNMNEGVAHCQMLFDGERPDDWLYHSVNAAYERLTGFKDVAGKKLSELNPGMRDSHPELLEIFGKVAATGTPAKFETYIEPLDIFLSVSTYSPQAGHFVAVLDNITQRKRAEAALRESREQLRLFVEHTPAPIAMFDRQMRYVAYSQRWITDYGLVGQDLIGRSHYDVFTEIPERWKQIHQRCLSGGVERCDEDPFPRSDGAVDWLRWEIHPWRNGKGEIGGIIIFSEKITDRKRAEAQLIEAQKMESVGRIAGGVAHEFNNLLTVINGYSQFLLDRLQPSDPSHSFAEAIKESGERAATLTKQLLAFSRKQLFRPRTLDVNAVIRTFALVFRRLIGADITLVTNLEDGAGEVMADPDQLHQVILNLVLNARDAMPNGGRVEIATANVELNEQAAAAISLEGIRGCYVCITVTDNGCGMDENTRQHVFEPFFTKKGVGEGTGLGLSTAYGIIRQSGGYIDVQSELGVGSEFKVYLPLIKVPSLDPLLDDRKVQASGGTETILVVEDESSVLAFTKAALTSFGYHVITAPDGERAIAVVEQHPGEIDLLLTDIMLPGMNGRFLAEQLRALRPNLRVVYVSGYSADVIGQGGALDLGVAFIQKPFGPVELAAKVREVLERPSKPSVES